MSSSRVHITFTGAFTRFWPILKTDLGITEFGQEPPQPNQTYAVLYYLVRRWGLTKADVDRFNGPIAQAAPTPPAVHAPAASDPATPDPRTIPGP